MKWPESKYIKDEILNTTPFLDLTMTVLFSTELKNPKLMILDPSERTSSIIARKMLLFTKNTVVLLLGLEYCTE